MIIISIYYILKETIQIMEALSRSTKSEILPQLSRTHHYFVYPHFTVFSSCHFLIKLLTFSFFYSMYIQRCQHNI